MSRLIWCVIEDYVALAPPIHMNAVIALTLFVTNIHRCAHHAPMVAGWGHGSYCGVKEWACSNCSVVATTQSRRELARQGVCRQLLTYFHQSIYFTWMSQHLIRIGLTYVVPLRQSILNDNVYMMSV